MPGVSTRGGEQVSASARCNAKYLLHMEGRSFSLAQLPQAGCGSLMVMGPHRYYTPIERAYRANGFFLPVQLPVYNPGGDPRAVVERGACENVSAAITWAESKAPGGGADASAAVAAEAAAWTELELSMQGIHHYMLEMLRFVSNISAFYHPRNTWRLVIFDKNQNSLIFWLIGHRIYTDYLNRTCVQFLTGHTLG
jgi:hypothetical protein